MKKHTANKSCPTWLAKWGRSATGVCALGSLLTGAVSIEAQPTSVASTPTAPFGHVISLYDSSAVYTNITGINFYEIWWSGQWSSFGDYTIAGTASVVKGYQNLLFTGVGFEGNPQNISGCTNLHVDVFTPNGDSFDVRMVDTSGHSADITYTAASGVITNSGWIGLDLPLSQFKTITPSLDLTSIQQLGWIINGAGEDAPADYYVDNVYFAAATNLVIVAPPANPAPTNNAPTPTQSATNVLALYNSSGVYTDAANINFYPWGAARTAGDFTNRLGRVLKSYVGLSYYGVELDPDYNGGADVDASAFNTLHVDVWTTANQLAIKLVSTDNGAAPEVIIPASSGTITSNHWVGLDIPLAAFTALVPTLDLTHLSQLLWIDNGDIAGAGTQNGIFYIDNVYFYNQVSTTVYVDPSQSWVGYMNVSDLPSKGGAYEFGSAWGTAALPAVFNGPVVTLSPNVNTYDGISDSYWVNPDGSGNKTCDASFYVQNDGLAGQLVTFTGYCDTNTLVAPYTSKVFIKDLASDYSSSTFTNLALTSGTSFSISFLTNPGDHIQYGFETVGPDANPATVASLGNVLISSNVVVTPPPPNYPTNNAPVPTRPSGSVLALYNSSGTYTDASSINFYPWGAASGVGDYSIAGGGVVKSYLGLQYYGVEMNPDYSGGADVDASAYSTLHVDVWTTANQLAIKLVSTMNGAAPELIYAASSGVITSNHWVSLDIPLTAFTSLVPTLDLTHLDQLLWIDNGDISGPGVQGGSFYIDNVYFYSNASATSPKISAGLSGGNRNLTFATQTGFTYTVQYKNNLSDASWTTLSSVSGTGSPATVSDTATGVAHRFYRVSIQ